MDKFQGIIPAVVTPFDEEERLNEEGMREIIDFLVKRGVHGIFAVGSQGEFYSLTEEEKKRLIEVCVDAVDGRVPLLIGTGGITTRECIRMTQYAQEAGATAVSLITPYYINPSQEELYLHYQEIAKSTNLPLFLYTNPSRTTVDLAPETVAGLADGFDNVVGIKDSSGNLAQTAEYIRLCPKGFKVLVGRDTLIYGGLLYGAVGAVAATANVVPDMVVGIYDSVKNNNLKEAGKLQEQVALLRNAFSLGTFPVVVKEAMQFLGLPAGPCRKPILPLNAKRRAQLKDVLVRMGIL